MGCKGTNNMTYHQRFSEYSYKKSFIHKKNVSLCPVKIKKRNDRKHKKQSNYKKILVKRSA